MTKYIKYVVILITVTLIFVLFLVPDNNFHIITCDVGQGDAMLIVHKDKQVVIDAGPVGGGVISCLNKYIPFWDRKIELAIMTHPQVDHYGGFIEIFNSYKVDNFLSSGLVNSTPEYQALVNAVGGSGARLINAQDTASIGIGLIHIDIVHPSTKFIGENCRKGSIVNRQEALNWYGCDDDPNDFSVVANLRLGNFTALLTGDIGEKVIDRITASGDIVDVDYIKIPHHGSKNGLNEKLLNFTKPEVAVISVGKKNSFGHPHKLVLDLLNSKKVMTLRTDINGDIEIATDGQRYWIVK